MHYIAYYHTVYYYNFYLGCFLLDSLALLDRVGLPLCFAYLLAFLMILLTLCSSGSLALSDLVGLPLIIYFAEFLLIFPIYDDML